MTSSHPLPVPCQWFARLASALDRRSVPRLALPFPGAVLARGRRTVTGWIRATGLSGQFGTEPLDSQGGAGRETVEVNDGLEFNPVPTTVPPMPP